MNKVYRPQGAVKDLETDTFLYNVLSWPFFGETRSWYLEYTGTMNRVLTALMVFSMVLWGGSWVSGKLAAVSVDPFVIIFWRFLITALSLLPLLKVFKQRLSIGWRSFRWLIAASSSLFIYNICFFVGLKTGLAGKGGLIVTTLNPLFTFLLTFLIQRAKISKLQALGLFLGFAGGFVMLEVWLHEPGELLAGGNILFLAASLLWALLTIASGKAQESVPFISYSIWVYGLTGLMGLAASLVTGSLWTTPIHSVPFWLNILYLSVGATSFATTVYFLCTSRLGSRRASAFIFTVPVSALLFSWLFLKEVPTVFALAGGALAIGAVYVIHRARSGTETSVTP